MRARIVSLLEKAFNRYLQLDPESSHRLHQLQGKAINIKLRGLPLLMQLQFSPHEVSIRVDDFIKAEAEVTGTPLRLFYMATGSKQHRKHFFAEDIEITGNAMFADHVTALFDELEIDWEEYVSQWVGDVPAHQLGRAVHHFQATKQRIKKSLSRNINEYLHEEINFFPAREALQDFFHEVDEIRMDVDRLELRMNYLQKKIAKKRLKS